MSRRPGYDEEDDYDDLERHGSLQPHRGTTILVLGIISLMFTCFITGIVAWMMGRRDLELMKRGQMDDEGKAMTQVGSILGLVSTIIFAVVIFGYAVLIAIAFALKK